MRLSKRTIFMIVGLLALVLLIAYAATAMARVDAPLSALREEAIAYSSLVPFFSVVGETPFAAFTEVDELKATSLIPYYSVLH